MNKKRLEMMRRVLRKRNGEPPRAEPKKPSKLYLHRVDADIPSDVPIDTIMLANGAGTRDV